MWSNLRGTMRSQTLNKIAAAIEEIIEDMDIISRCWEGYEPVPGKEPYEKGSCRKKASTKSTSGKFSNTVKIKSAPR